MHQDAFTCLSESYMIEMLNLVKIHHSIVQHVRTMVFWKGSANSVKLVYHSAEEWIGLSSRVLNSTLFGAWIGEI
jgi:hypothetical protein